MKNLLTILVIFFGMGATNAQNLTFDETVNYINKFFSDNSNISYYSQGSNSGHNVYNVKGEKNGKIIFLSNESKSIGSFNLFDFEKIVENSRNGFLYVEDKNAKTLGMLHRFPPTYILKFEKALKYLRTLCVKEKDPFE